jgi:hypothetical protein
MKNIIQFRFNFINLSPADKTNINGYAQAMSVSSELMQFGYLLSQKAIGMLSSASTEDITKFYNEIISYLKDATGSNHTYKPFWPGFPQQVMELSECDLWWHQTAHYISNGLYLPNDFTKTRPLAFEQPKYTIINTGTDENFLNIFTDLISVNQSLTPDYLEMIKWFATSGLELKYPTVIPFKENLCTLYALGLNVPIKTVTDVLRIAVSMSGGDISLPRVPYKKIKINAWSKIKFDNVEREKFKFKSFTRSERRALLSLLEQTNCDAKEAILKGQRWIRLGERLHPGEYKSKYPKAYDMFDAIRNDKKLKSWYGDLNTEFNKSFGAGLDKLAERPGELVRRLDSLLRKNSEKHEIIFSLLEIVLNKVSNKVLYEVYTHFLNRDSTVTGRTIMIKGDRKKTVLPDLPAISIDIIDRLNKCIVNALCFKFSTLKDLNNVYIDEELKKIPLPTNMRSLNSALKPIIRGQKIPMGNQNAKVIRAYVHWYDKNGTEDLDLSATFIGPETRTKIISWNNSKNNEEGLFSGDIRHVQGPCAEYIDINIAKSIENGYKYIILDVRNFSGETLSSIDDCVFGYMEREFPVANEIFVPSTIANCVRLNSPSANTIVCIIDIETQEYIYLDIDQNGIPVASANYEDILKAIKPYMVLPVFSVYDLLQLHVKTRGKQVYIIDEADTKLTYEMFGESYVEIMKWMGV